MGAVLLDTSVAIPLRDGDPVVVGRATSLPMAPYFSILTVAELEGGVFAAPAFATARRAALDLLIERIDILPFGDPELAAYRNILAVCGYARAKVIDRLISATALANGLALATRNAKDFRDVPGLQVEEW